MKRCDYRNIAGANSDGQSIIKIYAGHKPGRYQPGKVEHREFTHVHMFGIVDTETMTMPVMDANEPELSHWDIVSKAVALAVLNDRIDLPEERVMPGRFEAYERDYGTDLGSNGVIMDTRPRFYLPLYFAPLGTAQNPYGDGMACLAKIANAINTLGLEYKYKELQPGGRHTTKLPDWCPEPFIEYTKQERGAMQRAGRIALMQASALYHANLALNNPS